VANVRVVGLSLSLYVGMLNKCKFPVANTYMDMIALLWYC